MEPLIVPPCPRCGNKTSFDRVGELAVRCLVCFFVRVARR